MQEIIFREEIIGDRVFFKWDFIVSGAVDIQADIVNARGGCYWMRMTII